MSEEVKIPKTVKETVYLVVEELDTESIKYIYDDKNSPWSLHHTIGRRIRNAWGLWSPYTELKEDAATNYGIAHPDDITGLLLEWVWAVVRNEDFDPQEECLKYIKYWKNMGTDALKVVNWKPSKGE
jgi:hypothetical protein